MRCCWCFSWPHLYERIGFQVAWSIVEWRDQRLPLKTVIRKMFRLVLSIKRAHQCPLAGVPLSVINFSYITVAPSLARLTKELEKDGIHTTTPIASSALKRKVANSCSEPPQSTQDIYPKERHHWSQYIVWTALHCTALHWCPSTW